MATLSGTSVTLSAAVPKGASIEGVQSIITTAIGGATGYQVGTTADTDLYGVRSATTVGSGTDDNSWTANGSGYQISNLDIVVSAVGGTFTAGAISVTVQYSMGQRSYDTA